MTLELNGIDVDCIIGERADERNRLQRLMVDIRLEVDDAPAVSDMLSDAVDYAALTESVRAALIDAKCMMIERAAKTVCDLCMADGKVFAATVRVTKSGAVPHLVSATASYSAQRCATDCETNLDGSVKGR